MDAADRAACFNCGAERLGPYCHACGQEAIDPEAGAVRLLVESVLDALSVDHRALRTVRTLVAQPGALAEAWADGRRVPFVSPVRLFLVLGALLVALGLVESAVTPDPDGDGVEVLAEATSAEETDRTAVTTQNAAYWVGVGIGRLGVYAFLVFVPVVGFAYWVLFGNQFRSLAPHLVHAMHLAAASVLLALLWLVVRIAWLVGWPEQDGETLGVRQIEVFMGIGMAFLFGYATVSIRRFYRTSWGRSVATATLVIVVPLTVIIAVAFTIYLALITV